MRIQNISNTWQNKLVLTPEFGVPKRQFGNNSGFALFGFRVFTHLCWLKSHALSFYPPEGGTYSCLYAIKFTIGALDYQALVQVKQRAANQMASWQSLLNLWHYSAEFWTPLTKDCILKTLLKWPLTPMVTTLQQRQPWKFLLCPCTLRQYFAAAHQKSARVKHNGEQWEQNSLHTNG